MGQLEDVVFLCLLCGLKACRADPGRPGPIRLVSVGLSLPQRSQLSSPASPL